MPVQSMAQLFKLRQLVREGKMTKAKFNEFVDKTPSISKLPYRKGMMTPTKAKRTTAVAKPNRSKRLAKTKKLNKKAR